MLPHNLKEILMKSSAMTGKFGAFLVLTGACASVLVFHSAALAQQAAPAAKPSDGAQASPAEAAPEAVTKQSPNPELPPEYAPPPGYHQGPPMPPQPPAPGYYGQYDHGYYGPPAYYPPPPPRYGRPHYFGPAPVRFYPEPLTYRPFYFGFGLGVAGVGIFPNSSGTSSAGSGNSSRAGIGYNLRLGFGLSPRWSLVLAADGATAYFDSYSVSQTAWTIGPQVFLTPHLYARAGLGAATYSQDLNNNNYSYAYDNSFSDSGMAVVGALGFEFAQSYHTALAIEAAGTAGYYPNKDTVSTFGVNFVLNLF
jgi:hypothetical protein